MKQITIYDLLPLLKKEEWKPLLNGKYFISNFGRVYSSYSKGIMKPFETKKGYLRVNLFDKGKKKGWRYGRKDYWDKHLNSMLWQVKNCLQAANIEEGKE